MLPENIEISPEEIVEKIKNSENLVFLDVRKEEKYKDGHLKDAILIPLIDLSPEKVEQAGIKKDAETIVYCQRGERSETASEMMLEWGYKVRHLTAGLDKWTEKEFIVK
jgi:rhodanese-related sulfurtransferase